MSDYLEVDPAELGPAGLDWLATRLLIELELLSDVSAASLGQHVKAGKPGHKILVLASEPAHLLFRRRYVGCHTDDSRRAVIRDAQAELRAHRFSRRPNLDLETREGKLAVGRDTRPVSKLAYIYGKTERTIYNWRAEARKYDARNNRRAA